ncbi:MAG: membrane dipeptidase [Gemmatimonadota bacterium]|nr:membrane dipeptidase [Gemmatimonadota bacterium]
MTVRRATNPAMPLALALALALTTSGAACAPADQPADAAGEESEEAMIQRAREIHDRVVTLDTHIDISTANFTAERNYTTDLPTQVTLPKMGAGGLDVGWFVVYTSQGLLNDEGYATAYENAVDKFDAIHRMVNQYAPDRIELALTSEDVRRIAASGKLVAMIGVENAYPLGTDISRVEEFHERGARYMSLAHTGPNQLSDAHSGENDGDFLHGGLSEMGREAVAEMNRLGIMIDISHPSKPSIMQTLEMTRAPVMASHSSARGLSDVSRNLDDEQLHAVAANGGVVQTVALRRFVNTTRNAAHREAMDAIEAEVAAEMGVEILGRGGMFALPPDERDAYFAQMTQVRATAAERAADMDIPPDVSVADFVDQIDYMVNLIGLEHVGISSDFDGGGGVDGWDDASETFNVTLELVRRGYTEEEIGLLWSGNLLRVLDEVQEVAAIIQAEEG